MNPVPATVNAAMMIWLPHGYCIPPFSRANMSGTQVRRETAIPTKSTPKRVRPVMVSGPAFLGNEAKATTKRTLPAGTLEAVSKTHMWVEEKRRGFPNLLEEEDPAPA